MCLTSSLHTATTLGTAPGPFLQSVCGCQGSPRTLAELWMNTVTAHLNVRQVDVCPVSASLGSLCSGIILPVHFSRKIGLQRVLGVLRSRQTPTAKLRVPKVGARVSSEKGPAAWSYLQMSL